MKRRVVVVGIGCITPIGSGAKGLWAGVVESRRGGRAITRFDPTPFRSRVAAEIDDFDPLDYMDTKRARRLDRFAQLAIASSRQALECAGLLDGAQVNGSSASSQSTAIYLGSALGGIAYAEEQHSRFLAEGFHAVDPSLALAVFGGAGATNVAMEFGLRGPVVGNANSCASGLIAIGEAYRLVSAGHAEVALAGAAEAPLAPLTFGAFARIRALTTSNDDPERASRPFDKCRDGFLMAEGAAMVVLEELEHALRRGARPIAEVIGYGTTNDAYHMTAPLPSGAEAARSVTLALEDAEIAPEEVAYLNAHATSTPLGDTAEALAIRKAFGSAAERLPVSGTKGLHGHALGASGAIEAAITCLCLEHGWLPPSANLEEADPSCQLCHVAPEGQNLDGDVAVTNSFGFGGINASLTLHRWSDR